MFHDVLMGRARGQQRGARADPRPHKQLLLPVGPNTTTPSRHFGQAEESLTSEAAFRCKTFVGNSVFPARRRQIR